MKHRQVVAAPERMHELLDEGASLASTMLDFDRVHFAGMHGAAPNAAVGRLWTSS